MIEIFPSLIAADLLNLQREINILDPHCPGFHIDVMDGHFVPNITFGASMVNAIDRVSKNPVWLHLMVENPQMLIERLHIKEGSTVTFHIEIKTNIKQAIIAIQEKKCRPSLAINPKTNLEKLFPHLNSMVEQVLVMSVDPGFSGQKFIPDSLEKISALVNYKREHHGNFKIAVDGGIDAENIHKLVTYGVDQLAVATSIFSHEDRINAFKNLMSWS